jgi:16S rRNA (adenine1518-N6/adenine1519-N6)-dimethyltransferase
MRRYLGQHFLVNKRQLRKFVGVLEIKPDDIIIEIGPGHGELTKEIIQKFRNSQIKKFKIIAIEKDKKLVEFLRKKFSENKNIKIIHGDVLKILPKLITQLPNYPITNYKLVGNIPYYITGYLLRVLAELEHKPSLIVLTIQKEVAQRIIAESPRMNLLSASIQFWAEPEIIGYISKKDSRPIPKVDSTIIKFNIRRFDLPKLSSILRRSNLQEIKDKYYRLIRVLFKQPRKTILNNLTMTMTMTMTKKDITKKLKKLGINPSNRPQNLNIKQILKLSTLF